MIWPILEARAEIQKYFLSDFGSNENIQICFRDEVRDVYNFGWSSSSKKFRDFFNFCSLLRIYEKYEILVEKTLECGLKIGK